VKPGLVSFGMKHNPARHLVEPDGKLAKKWPKKVENFGRKGKAYLKKLVS
jgi:hypothetical protein